MPAALAAEAAGAQGKFWEMHDKLFANQRDMSDENIEKWAAEIGLNVETFKQDYQSQKFKKKIEDQQRMAVSLGARGTPAFFINGRFLSGAQPFDNFKKIIDEELQKAKDAIAKGTKPDEYYDSLVKSGSKTL